jgi:hypothetical protein
MGKLIDSDVVSTKVCLSGYSTNEVEDAIDKTPIAFDVEMVLDQLEDCGKYKGVLMCNGDKSENYIPVSVAKQIVRAKGLCGVLGYLEEKGENKCTNTKSVN